MPGGWGLCSNVYSAHQSPDVNDLCFFHFVLPTSFQSGYFIAPVILSFFLIPFVPGYLKPGVTQTVCQIFFHSL